MERTEGEMMAPPFRRITRVDEEILNIYSQQEKTQVIRKWGIGACRGNMVTLADPRGNATGSKFFHFHAVFRVKN